MKLTKIGNMWVNLENICTISVQYGCDCGAPYDEQDRQFYAVAMKDGKVHRAELGSPAALQIEGLIRGA